MVMMMVAQVMVGGRSRSGHRCRRRTVMMMVRIVAVMGEMVAASGTGAQRHMAAGVHLGGGGHVGDGRRVHVVRVEVRVGNCGEGEGVQDSVG